ncbi:MAG: MBL fold metallo-hydrolase [Nanoarchaeota archaeon]|nr:MBL fold metallo-hydrolase [Nanoarchaeota archaeon]MBU1622694.1 MBL fold metallo-hydrolase [Nanoarchaeota archaeon]MBU1974037.1 MBL fold metallo-hydrolase [Nanoarchaeota archaeon]
MKVTVLGSGTFIPNLKRNAPGYLLEFNGKKILIDCGSSTLLQLEKIKSESYKELDYIFITHTHTDHVSDLDALLHVLKWNKGREKELVFVGPKEFKDFYLNYLEPIIEGNCDFKIMVKEIEDNFNFEDFNVEAIRTKHTDNTNSVAYKFIIDNKRIIFSGDMGYDEKFIEFSQDGDLLILECTISTTEKNGWNGHLNAEQCAEIAKKANPKKLILTHLHKDEKDNQKKLEIVKKEFPNVELAYDLMEIEL